VGRLATGLMYTVERGPTRSLVCIRHRPIRAPVSHLLPADTCADTWPGSTPRTRRVDKVRNNYLYPGGLQPSIENHNPRVVGSSPTAATYPRLAVSAKR